MIGDVNLFLNNEDDPTEAEIEVMIAGKIHNLDDLLIATVGEY